MRIPAAPQLIARTSDVTIDARAFNGVIEAGDVVNRPGVATTSYNYANAQGMLGMKGFLILVYGDELEIFDYVPIPPPIFIGDLVGGYYAMVDDPSTSPGGGDPYWSASPPGTDRFRGYWYGNASSAAIATSPTYVDRAGWHQSIDTYIADGGYEMLKQAVTMERQKITDEVKASGLRGRGGAGLPTGVKWAFIPPTNTKPVYIICNADESEPGTFKDRYILHQDPHQLLEGMIIACFAVNAKLGYIYIREEFPQAAIIVEKAIAEAHEKGFLGKNIQGSGFDCEIYVHRGAGAYICGEETGLIESLEGKRPYPRIKPPYIPAALGLYMSPTIVNNVESLCHVKHIIQMGGAEYAKLGPPNNTGTRILCVSGDVVKPGYYEVEVGKVTMREVIDTLCGGLKPGRKLKAIIPGGSSSKVLRADEKFKLKDGREIGIIATVIFGKFQRQSGGGDGQHDHRPAELRN